MMLKLKDCKVPLTDNVVDSGWLDLAKVVGRGEIDHVACFISTEFGTDAEDLVLAIVSITFKDGTRLFFEGEHDLAYIPQQYEWMKSRLEPLHNEVQVEEDSEAP